MDKNYRIDNDNSPIALENSKEYTVHNLSDILSSFLVRTYSGVKTM